MLKGVGDDCAVLRYDDEFDLLITTDLLLEGTHFRLDWSTPAQIGNKAMESNVSDIAAMGGIPRYAFVSVAFTGDFSVEQADELYAGMNKSCDRHGVSIVGGDTTKGALLTLNILIVGMVEKGTALLRCGALCGDLVAVTGSLGKSEAGLQALQNGLEGNIQPHLEPTARTEWGRLLRPYANSMIDVSDGLAGDIIHICDESNLGVEIDGDAIPLFETAMEIAARLGHDPLDYALSGGEDFELLFTFSKSKTDLIQKTGVPFTVIGKITEATRLLRVKRRAVPLKGGYDHFF